MISRDTVRRAKAAIKRRADYEYFFNKLTSPEWLKPLYDEGFFREPPRSEREGDFIRFPDWPEGRYLVRMASLEPEAVADILSQLPDIDNPRVHDDVIEAALAMPAKQSARLTKRIGSYVRAAYHLLLPYKLDELTLHLARGGMKKQALDLLRNTLALQSDPSAEKRIEQGLPPEPSGYIDDFQYQETLEKTATELTRLFGMDALRCLGSILESYIYSSRIDGTYTGPDDASYLHRSAIEDHEQNWGHGIIDPLIVAVRDSALEICTANPEALPTVLEYLESRSWFVFWRIAMFLLYTLPDVPITLAATRILDEQRFKRAGLRHEYVLLLSTHYAALEEAQKEAYLGMVDGDQSPEDIRRIYAGEERKLSDEDVQSILQHRRVERLHPIQPHLLGEVKAEYERLVALKGQPDHPEFLTFHSGVVMGPNSPATSDELCAMSVKDLVKYLSEWESPENVFMEPTPEGLGRVLGEVVASDASRFAAAADQFIGLPPTYVRFFLHGIELSVKNEALSVASWEAVLRLASWAVQQRAPTDTEADDVSGDEDPGWRWTCKQVADLLEVGASRQASGLSVELASQVWSILACLADDPDPTPAHEEKYGGDNMDPLTLSLNTTRGAAMHAVVQYALWKKRHAESTELPEEVRQVLETHLDSSTDPSLAVRAVYGRWLPWLYLMDSNWTKINLAAIFPEANPPFRSAAWNAYVSFCPPYNDMLTLLAPEYVAAVDRLSPRDGRHALVEHLCVFYCRGLLPLEAEVNPLRHLFENADAPVRGRAIVFIGRVLDRQKDDFKDALDRLKQLWEWRFKTASEASEIEPYIAELAEFGSWFASGAFDDEWSLTQLVATLNLIGQIKSTDDVVEHLATVALRRPADAVACLELLMNRKQKLDDVHLSRKYAKEVLRVGLTDANPDVQANATQIIHTLGAMGYLDYRELLKVGGSSAE